MRRIALRRASRRDSDFCYDLHKAAMGDYVAAVWGWDEKIQREYHDRAFAPERWQIITADDEDIGMLAVEYRPGEVYLGRIEIHPGHQGEGIGTGLIGALIEEAEQRGEDLVLEVLAVNERARALYERLGLRADGVAADDRKVTMRFAGARRRGPEPPA